MYSILDRYLDLNDNPILGSSLTTTIKNTIVSAADTKVNDIKNGIITKIQDMGPCSNQRRLQMYEVDGYGSQRMLEEDVTFDALESAIKSINDNVQTVSAGYFPGRNEIAIDVGIHVEQTLDDTTDFKGALDTVFGYLEDAKAMFGASSSDAADVTTLLDAASAMVEFDLSIR